MTTTYQKIDSRSVISELRCRLPKQIRQAAMELIEADPSSDYYYKLLTDSAQIQLLLIEQNTNEDYTQCHCFSTDMRDRHYAYESLPLASVRMFSEMAQQCSIT
ncbi:MAG: hypothetical protein LBJ26_10485 [Paenibacillus sp.]|nr:hypothetical protein [Paenibacillus sp.]